MNKVRKQWMRNRLIQKIRFSNRSGSHSGCIRVFCNNDYKHEKKKFDVCWSLLKAGYEIFTEAIFTNGSRADIVGIKDGKGLIVEILHTETKEQLAEKIKKYPSDFEIISVRTEEKLNNEYL